MAELNIDALITEFGAKYQDNGQTLKDIKKQLLAQDDIMMDFKRKPHGETYYTGVSSSIGETLQPLIKEFVSKGDPTFAVWKQKMGEFKIDKSLYPDEYYNSWLGFLGSLTEADRSKWPIIQYMIQEQLLPGSKRDFVKEVAYWGFQFTSRAGSESVSAGGLTRVIPTGSPKLKANASMDGIRIQFARMVAASAGINVYTMGAWDSDPVTFVTQVEDMYAQVPDELLSLLDFAYMSKDLRTRYRDGVREKYNKYYAQESELDGIKDTNIKVKKTVAMTSSQKIWSTPDFNRVFAVRDDQTGKFDIQRDKRQVNFMNSYSYLLTFDMPSLIVTSEHENTVVSGEVTGGGRYATTISA